MAEILAGINVFLAGATNGISLETARRRLRGESFAPVEKHGTRA